MGSLITCHSSSPGCAFVRTTHYTVQHRTLAHRHSIRHGLSTPRGAGLQAPTPTSFALRSSRNAQIRKVHAAGPPQAALSIKGSTKNTVSEARPASSQPSSMDEMGVFLSGPQAPSIFTICSCFKHLMLLARGQLSASQELQLRKLISQLQQLTLPQVASCTPRQVGSCQPCLRFRSGPHLAAFKRGELLGVYLMWGHNILCRGGGCDAGNFTSTALKYWFPVRSTVLKY
jgi:hypothetical protein